MTPSLRVLCVLLTAAALASCGLGAAGDECITPSDCAIGLFCFAGTCTAEPLACGPGTVLDESTETPTCQPEARALRCGPGTILEGTQCVPIEVEEEEEPEPEALDAGVDAGPEGGQDAGLDGGQDA